jgi:hypothetical protein
MIFNTSSIPNSKKTNSTTKKQTVGAIGLQEQLFGAMAGRKTNMSAINFENVESKRKRSIDVVSENQLA